MGESLSINTEDRRKAKVITKTEINKTMERSSFDEVFYSLLVDNNSNNSND
jgi:hypothetical protein